MSDRTQLTAQLRDARIAQGLSQLDLAVRADTHQSTVGGAESGRRPAGLATLIRLADALGYDLALIPRERPDEVRLDLEPPPSAETIASVLAIVDAPYQPGLDVRFEEDA